MPPTPKNRYHGMVLRNTPYIKNPVNQFTSSTGTSRRNDLDIGEYADVLLNMRIHDLTRKINDNKMSSNDIIAYTGFIIDHINRFNEYTLKNYKKILVHEARILRQQNDGDNDVHWQEIFEDRIAEIIIPAVLEITSTITPELNEMEEHPASLSNNGHEVLRLALIRQHSPPPSGGKAGLRKSKKSKKSRKSRKNRKSRKQN